MLATCIEVCREQWEIHLWIMSRWFQGVWRYCTQAILLQCTDSDMGKYRVKGKKYFERACYQNDLYKDPNPSEVCNILDTEKR
ncbi:hypothetical protein ACHAXS_001358 [Conticribra weissflogii]